MKEQTAEKVFYGKLKQAPVKTKADEALLKKPFKELSQEEVLKVLAMGRRF